MRDRHDLNMLLFLSPHSKYSICSLLDNDGVRQEPYAEGNLAISISPRPIALFSGYLVSFYKLSKNSNNHCLVNTYLNVILLFCQKLNLSNL